MTYSLTELSALVERSPSQAALAAMTLGYALPLLAERAPQPPRPLAWHLARLSAGMASGQLALRFDRFGQMCGLVQWARVSAEVSSRMLRQGPEALAVEEMAGGGEAWIVDFHAMHGELRAILDLTRDQWLRDDGTVTYFRTQRGRRTAKRVARSDRFSFFASGPSTAQAAAPADPAFLTSADAEPFRLNVLASMDEAQVLGEVLQLAGEVPSLAGLPLPLALTRLRTPLRMHQCQVSRDASGRASGFISWAWREGATKGQRCLPPHQLAPYEWSDGRTLLLQDAVARPVGIQTLWDALAQGLAGAPYWLREEADDGMSAVAGPLRPGDIARLHEAASRHPQPLDTARLLGSLRMGGVR